MVKKINTYSLIIMAVFLLSLQACKTAEKAATSTASSDNAIAGGNEMGTCVVKIEEQTTDPKNKIFISMNKKMKCSEYKRCYHITLEGTCDSLEATYVQVDAQERNSENFSSQPEKNGSFKYSKSAVCVDNTYKVGVWLQLKGTDSFEVKTRHYQSKDIMQKDPSNYVVSNTSTFQPNFDAGAGEVKGFTDRSSTYNNKLLNCRRKFPTTYLKKAQ